MQQYSDIVHAVWCLVQTMTQDNVFAMLLATLMIMTVLRMLVHAHAAEALSIKRNLWLSRWRSQLIASTCQSGCTMNGYSPVSTNIWWMCWHHPWQGTRFAVAG